LTTVLAASVLSFVAIALFGHISDRIGAALKGVVGFLYFAMLDTGS
jgi:hypothetical protein